MTHKNSSLIDLFRMHKNDLRFIYSHVSLIGADLDRVSALFFLAYANSAGGVMKLLMATERGAQELRVKVREKGNNINFTSLLTFQLWLIHREALNK